MAEGSEILIDGITKSFGKTTVWRDMTFTIPKGEISVLLGPSGTGKSVFLKCLIGLLKPEFGRIVIHDTDLMRTKSNRLYELRKLFGVLFQDGALFGSMDVFDNVAFPLREHTHKTEREIREIVMEKLDLVGLTGHENKLPGAVSGGMRKRAGLARGMVLDPEIMLFDEPDSGLDPVRTAYLNQLIVDLNERTDSTFLIVTHNIDTAQTLPDNIGIIYHKHLAMFGPREQLLTSEDAVVSQFLNGRREGPIGMSEEKDASEQAAEKAGTKSELALPAMKPQLTPTNGNPRKAEARRKERVMGMMNELTPAAQAAVRESLGNTGNGGRPNGGDRGYTDGGYSNGGDRGYSGDGGRGYDPRHRADRQR